MAMSNLLSAPTMKSGSNCASLLSSGKAFFPNPEATKLSFSSTKTFFPNLKATKLSFQSGKNFSISRNCTTPYFTVKSKMQESPSEVQPVAGKESPSEVPIPPKSTFLDIAVYVVREVEAVFKEVAGLVKNFFTYQNLLNKLGSVDCLVIFLVAGVVFIGALLLRLFEKSKKEEEKAVADALKSEKKKVHYDYLSRRVWKKLDDIDPKWK